MMQPLTANSAMPVEGEGLLLEVLPWLGLILLLVLVLVVTICLGRRLLREKDGEAEPFTLQSLRDLHASGQLSDEEYQRARDAMIGRVKSAAERKSDGDAGAGDVETPPEADGSDPDDTSDESTEPRRDADDAEDAPRRNADNKGGGNSDRDRSE